MKYTFTRRGAFALSAGLFAAVLSGPASAAETIKMIAIDGYPARAMWVKEFSGFFIPRVNEELAKTGNYAIEWQEYPMAHEVCTAEIQEISKWLQRVLS